MSSEDQDTSDLERSIPDLLRAESLPPLTPRRERARLTIQETVYHQLPTGQATCVGRPFSRELESEETPSSRSFDVSGEWTELWMGWCLDLGTDPPRLPSQVRISNDVGTAPRQAVPSPEELKADRGRIVEVARASYYGEGHNDSDVKIRFAVLRPGMSMRLEPSSDSYPLFARCLSGPARITVTAFPS